MFFVKMGSFNILKMVEKVEIPLEDIAIFYTIDITALCVLSMKSI